MQALNSYLVPNEVASGLSHRLAQVWGDGKGRRGSDHQQLDVRNGARLLGCVAPLRVVALDAGHSPWSTGKMGTLQF